MYDGCQRLPLSTATDCGPHVFRHPIQSGTSIVNSVGCSMPPPILADIGPQMCGSHDAHAPRGCCRPDQCDIACAPLVHFGSLALQAVASEVCTPRLAYSTAQRDSIPHSFGRLPPMPTSHIFDFRSHWCGWPDSHHVPSGGGVVPA